MFEKLKIIAICSIIWSVNTHAYVQTVAIPVSDFCIENSFILIAHDMNGNEQVIGSYAFEENKTEYSYKEMSQELIDFQSFVKPSDALISEISCNQIITDDQIGLYIHFQIDSDFQIMKVIIVRSNLFIHNPFTQQDITSYELFADDEDDDDWADIKNSDLPIVDQDKKIAEPKPLSYYETMVLLSYVAWAYGQTQVTQTYNSTLEWFKSKYAE